MKVLRSFILVTLLLAHAAQGELIAKDRLPLKTQGTMIVDKAGHQVRLACVSWQGATSERFVVNGLDIANVKAIAKKIAVLGFNCVDLPFSLEMYHRNPLL